MGYDKPSHILGLLDVVDIRAAITDYHCMMKVKAAMDQFVEGLDMGGIADYVKTHLDLIRPLLQYIPQNMNPGNDLH